MKVLTLAGSRREIIRLSLLVEKLDRRCEHVLVHAVEGPDAEANRSCFEELGVRAPDRVLDLGGEGFGARAGRLLDGIEPLLRDEQPDRILIAGGVSGLASLVAKRLGIEVVHLDAGSRCFDSTEPEESVRRAVDHSSDLLLAYTGGNRRNLLREGRPAGRVMVTGNPVLEVIEGHEERIAEAAESVVDRLDVTPGEFLLFAVRDTGDGSGERLRSMSEGVTRLGASLGMPVVTAGNSFSFFDFIALQMGAHLVLTDRPGVVEECCLFGTPAVTLGETTVRPETLECGANILAGVEPEAILRTAAVALDGIPAWDPPAEYMRSDVSSTVARLVLAGP
ncbi:MAG: UDP-N-acetylglucosamine 2-epimerase [Actinomycetota bacterium]|nr:UDP-N-acetylglucosamine 2-epimerase [Actinomycetota bacterium]